MQQRETQLSHWLSGIFSKKTLSWQPLINDASFRRYFRLFHPERTYIIMDAPPEKENCLPFIAINKTFSQHKINVPQIYHSDVDKGFLLLDDFGDQTYWQALKTQNPHLLYQQAIQSLLQIQRCDKIPDFEVPHFNADFMLEEIELFNHWFLNQLLGFKLSRHQQKTLEDSYHYLVHQAEQQPQVLIHRDYHSRNLMFIPQSSPGILDFQDAMWGPVTYDLVSLLKDCYVRWPEMIVSTWLKGYIEEARSIGLLDENVSESQFSHWFDMMGVQRHLKAIGIFARLHLRDHKSDYLRDIPRVADYIMHIVSQHEPLEPLNRLFHQRILPKIL